MKKRVSAPPGPRGPNWKENNMTDKKELEIEPIGARILLKRRSDDEMVGGIHIPAAAREKSQEAEVLALGTGKEDGKPFVLAVGDIVLLPQYGGTPVKIDDDEYILIEEEGILGRVKSK